MLARNSLVARLLARDSRRPQATLRVLGRESVNVNMAMAELLNSHGCVVEHSEQHRDRELGGYFQRAVFDWSAAASPR